MRVRNYLNQWFTANLDGFYRRKRSRKRPLLPLRFSVDRKQLKNRAFRIYDNLVINPTVKGVFKVYLNGKHLIRFQSEDGKFLLI